MDNRCPQLPFCYHVSIVNLGVDEGLSLPPITCVANHFKHPFLKRSWRKEKLQGLVSFVTLWKRPEYEYLGWKTRHEG